MEDSSIRGRKDDLWTSKASPFTRLNPEPVPRYTGFPQQERRLDPASSLMVTSGAVSRKKPPLTLEKKPLVLKNTRELSPIEEDNQEGLLGMGSMEGLIGIDQVVRGAHFAVHSCATYPFTILRRQFQVFPYNSLSLGQSMPWQTLAVMRNITLSQGVYSWWRGWQAQSVYLIGRPAVGAIVSRLVEPFHSKRTSQRSLWLKRRMIRFVVDGLTYTVCMPLISFILMESVQSTVEWTYSSDYAGLKEFIQERPLLHPDSNNCLSYLQLLAPTLITSMLDNLLLTGVSPLVRHLMGRHTTPTTPSSVPSQILGRLSSSVLSSFIVDLLLYPFSTINIRLHCQGLPILMENMETGSGLQYVKTFYSGPLDCISGVWEAEGIAGFYKGLSALLLQYTVQGILLFLLWKCVAYYERLKSNDQSN